jgi:hypothetical protein
MAIEGLAGNEFWKRLLLFVTDSTRLHKLTDMPTHESYLVTVPMNVIFKFTACQLAGLLICYGITWAGIAGISFPLFIMALVPVREFLMPKIFADEHLQKLDPLHLSRKEPVPDQARHPEQQEQVLQDRKQLDDLEALVSKMRTENETAKEDFAEVKAEVSQQARSLQKELEEAMISRADRDAAGKGGNQVVTPGAGGGRGVCDAIYASGVPDALDPMHEGIVRFSIAGGKILHTTSFSSRDQDAKTPNGGSSGGDEDTSLAQRGAEDRGGQGIVGPGWAGQGRVGQAVHHQAAIAVPRQRGMGDHMGEHEVREPPRMSSEQEIEQISDILHC